MLFVTFGSEAYLSRTSGANPYTVGVSSGISSGKEVRNDAIAEYGIMSKEPTGITGATLEYFNMEIKPELDRQHEQMMKGRDI